MSEQEILTKVYGFVNHIKVDLAFKNIAGVWKTVNELSDYLFSVDMTKSIALLGEHPAAQPPAEAGAGMSAEKFIEYIDKQRGNQVWSQDLLLLAQAFDAYHQMKSKEA